MASLQEKQTEIQTIIDNTRAWLTTFGVGSAKQRPQHEIDVKTRRLDVLKEIRDDYAVAIDRRKGAA